jgi:hypothetical protein
MQNNQQICIILAAAPAYGISSHENIKGYKITPRYTYHTHELIFVSYVRLVSYF